VTGGACHVHVMSSIHWMRRFQSTCFRASIIFFSYNVNPPPGFVLPSGQTSEPIPYPLPPPWADPIEPTPLPLPPSWTVPPLEL
jgi:hypothetical protein